jgi:hypothetical protein
VAQFAEANRRRSNLVAVASVVPCTAYLDPLLRTELLRSVICQLLIGLGDTELHSAVLEAGFRSALSSNSRVREMTLARTRLRQRTQKDAGNFLGRWRSRDDIDESLEACRIRCRIVRIGARAVLCGVHTVANELGVTSMPYEANGESG